MSTPASAGAALRLYGGADALAELCAHLPVSDVEVVPVVGIERLDAEAGCIPGVLLLDDTLADTAGDLLGALRVLPQAVVVAPLTEALEAALSDEPYAVAGLGGRRGDVATRAVLRTAFRLAAARLSEMRLACELTYAREELGELSQIGKALMTERDPDHLLESIVAKALALTASDAASLYLVEHHDGEGAEPSGVGTEEGRPPYLRFAQTRNETLPGLPFVSFTLPVDPSSLAGYVAATGEVLVADDAYEIAADAPYRFNRSFDERFGYRTRSMLVVPMVDHRDLVVGVLQLINRKKDRCARITSDRAADLHVLPYTAREVQVAHSLAGQAAVSIENARLYRRIEHLFESFVKAAVIAVDQRDPATSGHSVRVATLTCDLAATLSDSGGGPFGDVRFTQEQIKELRYASLLHDFGKVGVREEVLVKAKKLPPLLLERVQARFALIDRTLEADYFRHRSEALSSGGEAGNAEALRAREEEFLRRRAELAELRAAVETANQPSILPAEAAAILEEIARLTFRGPSDEPVPYLAAEELAYLRIPKGSLDERERLQIESHVEQTYRFLRQIPWTGDLKRVAEIAYGHHEKLNGRGYPRGIGAEAIPLQTRIMTVVDIFDALTASDRPYKRALPVDKAFDILHMEAREGLLDPHVVELLQSTDHHRRILETDWRAL